MKESLFQPDDIVIDHMCQRETLSYTLRLQHLPSGLSVVGRTIGPEGDSEAIYKEEVKRLVGLLAEKLRAR